MDQKFPPKADRPRGEKIFFLVLLLFTAGSVAATYYRYIVLHDYIIQAQADCDPYTEQCFVQECDPTVEECTGDPAEDTTYFKLIDRNAKNMPLCDSAEEGCEALTCPPGEAECTVTLCDPATAAEGEVCNDPAAYTLANPVKEEEVLDEEGNPVVVPEDDTSGGDTAPDGTGVQGTGGGNNDVTSDPSNIPKVMPKN